MKAKTTRKGQDPRRFVHVIGDIANVVLTQGKIAVIDAADAPEVGKYLWSCSKNGYVVAWIGGVNIYLHRFLLNPDPGQDTDHANGDKKDNRRANLRTCSRNGNCQNQRVRTHFNGKPKSSKFKGVCFDKKRGKYMASIQANGKRRFLGYFTRPAKAGLTYDRAARELHGKFASTNFTGAVSF